MDDSFSIIANEECSNDVSLSYLDISREKLDKFDEEELNNFIEQKGLPHISISTLLQDLCVKELIEPGDYLIYVCW